MTTSEWLDNDVVADDELNNEDPAVETVEEYGYAELEYPNVPAPVEPEEGQNAGEEVTP
jgi:hypothetical protein